MRRLFRHVGLVVAIMGLVGIGCNQGPDGGGLISDAVVYPWEGELGPGTDPGSTAAMVIDSNYMTEVDAWENYTLDTSRVRIVIQDPDPVAPPNWNAGAEVTIRSVFQLSPTDASKRHDLQPGFWFAVALFDLPGENEIGWVPAAPGGPEEAIAVLRLYVDDAGIGFNSRFRLMANKGRLDPLPNPLADESIAGQGGFQASLEPQRMIRLRGKRGDKKFLESQGPIGGMEFDLEYNIDCLDVVHAYPSTDASNATAILGPAGPAQILPGNSERVHVVMVDPKGIDLAFLHWTVYPGLVDESLVGQGPMLDLAGYGEAGYEIEGDNCITNPLNFAISDLLVTDINGEVLIAPEGRIVVDTTDEPNSTATLRMYAVDVNYAP